MATMKAAVFDAHGPIENLRMADLPVPEPGPGEVRVKMEWAALNHLDLWTRKGMPGVDLHFPHIGGSDGAGTVDAVGADVTPWKMGDRVVMNPGVSCGACRSCRAGHDASCDTYHMMGEHRPGSNAEYVIVPARNLVHVPGGYPLSKAAAAGVAYMTAYRMLVGRAQVRPGENVLVLGAGSGVSTAAIQIAARLGAVVYATTSSPEKVQRAKALGASHVIDYTVDDDWHKSFYKLTNKRGMDVVIDHVGEATWAKSVRSLAKGGRLVTCGGTTGPQTTQDVRLLFWRQLSILGSTMADHHEFAEVMELVYSGAVDPPIDEVFDLAQIQDAHRHLASGEQFGKVLLRIGGAE